MAHRLVLLAVAGTSMLALTGCTQSGNVAARVGDTTVPTSEVDFLTRMQCDSLDKAAENPQQGQAAQTVPTSQIRTNMVNALIQSELNRRLAASKDLSYDTATLRSVMQQFETTVKDVPKKDQDRFRDLVEDVYRGQLQVYTLAQNELGGSATQDQVQQAVAKIQDEFRKSVDVDVNPEYGADADGVAGSVDPSLSRAVSSFAKQSRSAPPDQSTDPDVSARYEAWVGKLPADQKCG
jgi:hypothetical protein